MRLLENPNKNPHASKRVIRRRKPKAKKTVKRRCSLRIAMLQGNLTEGRNLRERTRNSSGKWVGCRKRAHGNRMRMYWVRRRQQRKALEEAKRKAALMNEGKKDDDKAKTDKKKTEEKPEDKEIEGTAETQGKETNKKGKGKRGRKGNKGNKGNKT